MHPEHLAQLAYGHQLELIGQARSSRQSVERRRLGLFRSNRRHTRPTGP
jgi:hypothetical protein